MNKFIVGLMAIALLSCGQKQTVSEQEALLEKSKDELLNASKDLYSDGRSKMIKTAECRFQVADMKKSKEAVVSSIKKY